jgi:hypothetical protein
MFTVPYITNLFCLGGGGGTVLLSQLRSEFGLWSFVLGIVRAYLPFLNVQYEYVQRTVTGNNAQESVLLTEEFIFGANFLISEFKLL